MNKKMLFAGGILAVSILLGGNEIQNQVERTAAVAEFKQSVSVEYQKRKVGEEIKSLRKPNSATFKDTDGKYTAHIFSNQKYFLDTDADTLAFIDLTVHEISVLAKLNPLRTHDKFVDAGLYKATWFNGKPHDYTFYRGDYSLSYTALFDTVDVPVTTEFNTVGVKQTYTFKDVESVQDLKWLMSSNTIKQKQADGSINFYDDGYSLQFIMPAPTAWDANYIPILVTATISGDTLIYAVDVPEDAKYPVTVDPTVTIYGDTDANTGRVYGADATYLTARNATTGTVDAASIYVGQILSAGTYYIERGMLEFDTSGLPDGAASYIDSAKVVLVIQSDQSTTDFVFHTVQGTWTGSIGTGWYNDFTGWAASGTYTLTDLGDSISSAGHNDGDSLYIKLNTAGKAAIDKTGNTKLFLISTRDAIATAPPNSERLYIEDDSAYLRVWYEIAPTAPTAFANTGATTTTLSYSWTDNSDNESGFKIKRAGGDTATVGTYDADAEIGTVNGLGVNTRHGLRVFAYNAIGWSDPSDSVVTYTLANPPELWDFTNVGATGTVDVGFGENGNPSTTEYAVRDSTNTQWVQSADGTLGATIDWATYATWNAVTITQPGTTGTRFYAMLGRNGDSVLTAWLVGSLYVYKYPPPTSFSISNPDTTTLDVSWTLSGVHVDSLLIMNSPENTAVQYVSVAKTDTTVGGLTPNTLYTFFIRADSAGTKGDSNADSLYTLAAPPTAWDFTEDSPLELTPSFSGGSNPAGTQYAFRDSLRHVYIAADGTPSGTKVWRTEAQWEAITLTGLIYNQQYLLGVVAKNVDNIESTYLWGSVTTDPLTTTIQAIEDGGLVSIPQTSNYALFTPSTKVYLDVDSTSYAARDYTYAENAHADQLVIGQRRYVGVYYTYRSYLEFNTASIPDDAIIDSVKVKFRLTAKNQMDALDDLHLIRTAGLEGEQKSWWYRFYGRLDSGPYTAIQKLAPSENVSSLSDGDSVNIYYKLNAVGLAEINKTGTTQMVMITENDKLNAAPTGTGADSLRYITLDAAYVYMQVYYNPYAYSRNVATGTVVDTLKVGQDSLSVSRDVIDRSFMTFPMPAGMTSVTTATLNLYGYADSTSGGDFYIYIVGANSYRPTVTTADFVNFNGRQSLNTPHTSIVLNDSTGASSASYTAGWMSITLNTAGINSLEAASGDSVAFALISKNDYDATAPTGAENIMFYTATESGKEPYLDLNYAETNPSNFLITPETTTRLILTWNDNTIDNTYFRIIDPDTYAYLDSTTGVDAGDSTYIVISGLGINTAYRARVQVVGGASEFAVSNADSNYTLAAVPGLITGISYPTNTSIKFILNNSSNPAWTKFAVQDSISGLYVHVQAAGVASTLSSGAEWNTYATWGSANGDTLAVLAGREVRLRAAARNTAN